jgi:hypothetical protein
MANEWHYTQNGQPAPAPVSTAELKQMAASGRLQPTDLVWQDGMPGWVSASSIKGLFSSARSGEIPVPSPADSGRERAEPIKPREKEKEEKKEKERPRKKAEREDRDGDTTALASSSVLLEMHPVLVFILSLFTLGVFGILYALKASTALAKLSNKRAVDASNRPLGRYQHPIRILVLSFITLGFYYPFWVSRALRECLAYTNRPGVGGRLEFCLMLVIPFYSYFVVGFRLTPRVREVQARAGIPEEERLNPLATLVGGGFLMPVFGIGTWIMGMACQEALNEVWQRAA